MIQVEEARVAGFDEETEDNKEEALKFIKDLLERYEDEEQSH